jgi:hypothetical protein
LKRAFLHFEFVQGHIAVVFVVLLHPPSDVAAERTNLAELMIKPIFRVASAPIFAGSETHWRRPSHPFPGVLAYDF